MCAPAYTPEPADDPHRPAPTPGPVADEAPARRPVVRRFRRSGPAADPLLVTRQTSVTTLAFRLLGSADAARHFLNTPDAGLGGRPLDVAGASDEGQARVMRLLERGVSAPLPDDCFAARLAAAYTRRFGTDAGPSAARRLARAQAGGDVVKIDLFTAVTAILDDRDAVFSRSRRTTAG